MWIVVFEVRAHKLKEQKYTHFERDITNFNVSVLPFEVGSHTGFISKENKTRLASCNKSIKLKNFTNNISAICMMGSYYIFNCRSQELWTEMAYILAPFPNQWKHPINSYRKKPHQWPAGSFLIVTGVPGSFYSSFEAYCDTSLFVEIFQSIKLTLKKN